MNVKVKGPCSTSPEKGVMIMVGAPREIILTILPESPSATSMSLPYRPPSEKWISTGPSNPSANVETVPEGDILRILPVFLSVSPAWVNHP